ncbi:MAG TPA: cupredoxin domain-containing protein [Mariprofundaceae bacterium]|nr:cupredoxin domain-containing protein [Mariprofundaceae bacterium]
MIWLINLAGLLLIGFIVWWFWLWRPVVPKIMEASGIVEVHVKNGAYDPAFLSAKVGQPLRLRFIREDATPCAEYVVFEDFGIQQQLPLKEPVEFSITPDKAGRFDFTCQMQMYRGTLTVEP